MPFERLSPAASSNESEPKKDYLSERDKLILIYGFRELWNIFNEMPKENLPQLVLFAETSMRPLAPAVKMLIDKAYLGKDAAPPEYQFVSAPRLTPDDSPPEYQQLLQETHTYTVDRLKSILSSVSGHKQNKTQKALNVFVIDDFYNRGGTFTNIDRALQAASSEEVEPSATYFTFFLNNETKNPTSEWKGRLLHGSSYNDNFPHVDGESSAVRGFSYKTGDVHKTPSGEIFAQHIGSLFAPYNKWLSEEAREKNALLLNKEKQSEKISKGSLTGVKTAPYGKASTVIRHEKADTEQMRAIRKQISDLANEVIQTRNPFNAY